MTTNTTTTQTTETNTITDIDIIQDRYNKAYMKLKELKQEILKAAIQNALYEAVCSNEFRSLEHHKTPHNAEQTEDTQRVLIAKAAFIKGLTTMEEMSVVLTCIGGIESVKELLDEDDNIYDLYRPY